MDGVVHWEMLFKNWDLIIAHPPCTDLAVSGARWFKEKQQDGRQQKSIDFFMEFVNAECEHIAIENPVCIMSTLYRKPDQIIQPWQFGHGETKKNLFVVKGAFSVNSYKHCKREGATYLENGAWTGKA